MAKITLDTKYPRFMNFHGYDETNFQQKVTAGYLKFFNKGNQQQKLAKENPFAMSEDKLFWIPKTSHLVKSTASNKKAFKSGKMLRITTTESNDNLIIPEVKILNTKQIKIKCSSVKKGSNKIEVLGLDEHLEARFNGGVLVFYSSNFTSLIRGLGFTDFYQFLLTYEKEAGNYIYLSWV